MVTAIEGVVQNGKINLRDPVLLPENTRVYVIVPDLPAKPIVHIRSPHLVNPQDAARFQKQMMELPDNAKL